MSNRRITLRDIAKEAGVSHVTVSKALKNDPKISKATKDKVREIADSLGYIKDPVLCSLSNYRWVSDEKKVQNSIAWLDFCDGNKTSTAKVYNDIFESAKEQAIQYGFRLEIYQPLIENLKPQRLLNILQTKNTHGILLSPLAEPGDLNYTLEWDFFSVVSIGFSIRKPLFHSVMSSQHTSTFSAVNAVLDSGYKKIGLIIDSDTNERTRGQFLGGFLSCCTMRSEIEDFSILYIPINSKNLDDTQRIKDWVDLNQLDIVIGSHNSHFELYNSRVKGIPYITLDYQLYPGMYGSVDQRLPDIGKNAVDLVISMIARHETGIPNEQFSVQLQPTFRKI
jgi:LacI family transcriptional regulator